MSNAGNKKVPGEETLTDEDFTPQKQKEYLDQIILGFMKQGKDVNEVLKMPLSFVLEILKEENKPEETDSLIAAFGG